MRVPSSICHSSLSLSYHTLQWKLVFTCHVRECMNGL